MPKVKKVESALKGFELLSEKNLGWEIFRV